MTELGLLCLEKRRLQGDLIAAFQYLKGANRKDGENIFNNACCDRPRSNGFELREDRFRLDIRKTFFATRVMKHWHRFPREEWSSSSTPLVEAPSLETFKVSLDRALSNLV